MLVFNRSNDASNKIEQEASIKQQENTTRGRNKHNNKYIAKSPLDT
jgi:hypothetical protein